MKMNDGLIFIANVNLPLTILDFKNLFKVFVFSCQFVSKIINIRVF